MPLVLRNSTLAGNTAAGEQSNLMNFTKVMLRSDSAAGDSFAFQTREGDAGGESAEERQLDGFVVTFDRPSEPGFDTQGRLLIGTEGGIWGGAGDDVLIGGRTTFDGDTDGNDFVLWRKSGSLNTDVQPFGAQFRGGITVAVGDLEASGMVAGTQRASVTDLVIDPFNRDSGGENLEVLIKVLNAATGTFGDGSVRSIPPAVQQSEYESGLIYSGESGGMNGDTAGGTVGHFTQVIWADTRYDTGQANPPWGLDRIDQRGLPAGQGSVLDTSYDLLV
ncbi:MAG TPA: hypothetical protein VJT13_10000 [Xanthobacteraceae bacterium]|nr:hypothetical protein [Xanthobacteraceae bacterium]